MTKPAKTEKIASAESGHPLEEAVARALRDNLAPLQRTVEDLQQAYADLISACASSRASNALPAMLRAQAAAASLSAGLGVLSNFVTIALQPREKSGGAAEAAGEMIAAGSVAAVPMPPGVAPAEIREETEEELEAEEAAVTDEIEAASPAPTHPPTHAGAHAPAKAAAKAAEFDIAALPADLQELHRRAKRVAKVAMQDIKMLRPKDVRAARENKEICAKLRDDLDKARKEYDRRFKSILDHPVDYFHDWLVAILAEGDAEALGKYPYPSPVVRH